MKKCLLVAVALALAACGGTVDRPHQSSTSVPTGCTVRGDLPDPTCTPGVVDPRVTQRNIHRTICRPGYSQGVRPPVSYTGPLKIKLIAAYHDYAGRSPSRYELDHLIPLSFGGDPRSPQNLWPESSPNEKDKVEHAGYRAICAGRIPLAKAQAEMAADWHKFAEEPAVAAYLSGG